MVQFGQNAGPRHLRIFGYVNNLKSKQITQDETRLKDTRLLGVFGLVWNLLYTITPEPVIVACEKAMDAAELPRMATAYDTAG
jgi:hypothetical protein